MRRVLKGMSSALLTLLLLLIVISLIAFYLLGTSSGFSLTSTQLSKRVPGLELGDMRGNLVDGLSTDQLSFENGTMAVNAKGLDSRWRLSCLFKRKLCVDRIVIDEVVVNTFDTDTSPTESNGPVELPTIQLPVNIAADEVRVRQLTFQPPGDAPAQTINDIHLAMDTDGSLVVIETLEARYQDYTAKLAGNVELVGDYPLELSLMLNASDIIPNTLPEGAGDQPAIVDVNLSNTLRELGVNSRITGSVQATLSGTAKPLDKDLPVSITFDSPLIGWPIKSNTQIAASESRVTVDGTLNDYRLTLMTELVGQQVPKTRIELRGQVNQERLTLPLIVLNTLDGTATGSADLSWTENLQWNTVWNIKELNPALQIPELSGSLGGTIVASGTVENGNWTLALPTAKVSGVLQQYPFELDAAVSKGLDTIWLVDKLTLNNGKNRINARGQVSDTWNMQASLQLPDMQNFLPDLAGGFDANIDIQGLLTEPDVTLEASASVIKYNDILVQGLSLNADIEKLFMEDSNVQFALGTLQSGGQVVRNARMSLTGKRQGHTLNFFADGPEATAIDLTATGNLDKTFYWTGSLDQVKLEVPAHTIRLDQATELAWDNRLKKFAVDAHCWVTEGSRLCLENKVLAEATGSAIVSLDQYSLNRLDPFMPAETSLTGRLTMNSTINWGEDQPGGLAVVVNTRITDGGASTVDADQNPVSFTYDDLSVETMLNPQQIDATLNLTSTNLGTANAQLRLDPSAEEKPIEGNINLQGLDIGLAKAFLPDFDEVSGSVSIIGDLSGKLTDPRFDGQVVLNRPVLRAEMLPLPITGGRITASVKGKRAIISGNIDSEEGKVTIDGSANWQQPAAWNVDINLDGENLNIQSDPLQSSLINHDIRINLKPGVIRVDGNVDVPMAIIDVEELPQGAASVSSDIIIIEDIDNEPQQKTVDPPGDTRLQVAVDVSLGEDVRLSAYGLNARLSGDMTVRLKSPNPPQLGGEIQVVDGIYKQYGQNLEANGQILFVGPINQTRLAIDAVREIDNEERTAGLRIQGTVGTPEITLFTEPSDKSQEAILSYIVLGRDINETTDQEANLLATAALALTVKGGRDFAGGIASAIGVKDFALETRGNGDDTELVVSGRLNDRLLLRYGRSVFEPESTLYLRYDLTKKLYLEAAQGAERAVDLFYSFSF